MPHPPVGHGRPGHLDVTFLMTFQGLQLRVSLGRCTWPSGEALRPSLPPPHSLGIPISLEALKDLPGITMVSFMKPCVCTRLGFQVAVTWSFDRHVSYDAYSMRSWRRYWGVCFSPRPEISETLKINTQLAGSLVSLLFLIISTVITDCPWR